MILKLNLGVEEMEFMLCDLPICLKKPFIRGYKFDEFALFFQSKNAFFQELHSHPYIPNQNTDMTIAIVQKQVRTWVKVFRINPEFRILRLTFHRKSASKF